MRVCVSEEGLQGNWRRLTIICTMPSGAVEKEAPRIGMLYSKNLCARPPQLSSAERGGQRKPSASTAHGDSPEQMQVSVRHRMKTLLSCAQKRPHTCIGMSESGKYSQSSRSASYSSSEMAPAALPSSTMTSMTEQKTRIRLHTDSTRTRLSPMKRITEGATMIGEVDASSGRRVDEWVGSRGRSEPALALL